MLKKRNRPRHNEQIPVYISNVIRAGVLQSIDTDTLLSIVTNVMASDEDDDHEHVPLAKKYIHDISQHTVLQLLDGGFWWADTSHRKTGIRYKHMRRAKHIPLDHDTMTSSTETASVGAVHPMNEETEHVTSNQSRNHPDDMLDVVATQVNNDDVPVANGTDQNADTHQTHEGVQCCMHIVKCCNSPFTGNASDAVDLVGEPTSINDCEASSPSVVPANPQCIDDNEMRDIHSTGPAMEEVEEMNIVTDPQDMRQHETGLWDDVVHAIRDDLRVFWGLWETDIAPRLDPGIPVTHDASVAWKMDNIDIGCVLDRLRSLARQVKTITDQHIPKTATDERLLVDVRSLLAYLDRGQLLLFVQWIIVEMKLPQFVYPRPVD